MNTVLDARPLTLKVFATVATVALVATLAVVGPFAQPSHAADYSASDSATWEAAVAAALANTGETNTINITSDFTFELASTPVYDTGDHDLIIDGGGHTVTASATNTASFFDAYNGAGNITIRDLTLVGFEAYSVSYLETTGNIRLENITVTDFVGYHSTFLMDAFYIEVLDSTFERNTSEGDNGGAIYAYCSYLDIYDSVFADNTADGDGGAIYTDYCSVEIYESEFTDNTANFDGGAVYSEDSVYAEDSNFTGNMAGASGGAIAALDDVDPYRSTFTANHAVLNGGAVIVFDSSISATESTFTNNTAGGEGGAMWGFYYADSHESTWVGNEAAYGGAIYSEGFFTYSYYLQSTFVGNTATAAGGAVYAEGSYVEVYNTTMTGNEAPDGAHVYVNDLYLEAYASVFDDAIGGDGCYANDGYDSIGYNFDEDGTCTGAWAGIDDQGEFGGNPLLGPLSDNGGPTKTRSPLPGSPLIDAIPWAYCDDNADEAFDQRGVLRADTGAEVDGCDIGSVEVIGSIEFTIVDGHTGSGNEINVTIDNAYACDNSISSLYYAVGEFSDLPPAGVSFPYGVVEFEVCTAQGATIVVHLTYPGPVNTLYKIDGGWKQITGATFSGATATYSIVDNGSLDLNGDLGVINDPVGAGILASFTG